MSTIRTCLWVDGSGHEAAAFYATLIPGSEIEAEIGANAAGAPLMVNFGLAGVSCQALNGGPTNRLAPAASIQVITEDQAETAALRAALIADGGAEDRCAWCVDRFGLSRQVVPRALMATVGGPDPDGAGRATQAMLGMGKIDIAALKAAYRG